MAGVVPNAAEVDIANYAVNKAVPQDAVLRLFKNNVTPGETDTAATYTQATEPGYAAINCPGADWSVSAGDPTTAVCVQKTFTFTAAATIYGYYLVRLTSGVIIAAERFSGAPYILPAEGGEINVTPTLTVA